jgi:hypothetical protein
MPDIDPVPETGFPEPALQREMAIGSTCHRGRRAVNCIGMTQFNGEAQRRPSLVVSVIYYKTTVKKIIDDVGPIQLHCPEQYRRRLDDLQGWRKRKLLKDLLSARKILPQN